MFVIDQVVGTHVGFVSYLLDFVWNGVICGSEEPNEQVFSHGVTLLFFLVLSRVTHIFLRGVVPKNYAGVLKNKTRGVPHPYRMGVDLGLVA